MSENDALGLIQDARSGQNAAYRRSRIPPFVVVVVVGGVHVRIIITALLARRRVLQRYRVIVPRALLLERSIPKEIKKL